MNNLINFMVIGAVKAGTTSIYEYLNEHPQIYMSPIKETKFFQWDGETRKFFGPLDQKIYENSIKSFEDYQSLFQKVRGEIAIGEASPSYLYNKFVPKRIYQRFPNVKMIVILRQPTERAFSHYLHTKWLGYEPLSFTEALAQEETRIKNNWGPSWHYKQQGFYYQQLKNYFSVFDRQQIKIYLFDDLKANSIEVIENMYSFLGVDSKFIPNTSQKYNVRYFPKNQVVSNLINQPNFAKHILKKVMPKNLRTKLNSFISQKNRFKPELDRQTKEELNKLYSEDILNLQELLQKDLSTWL